MGEFFKLPNPGIVLEEVKAELKEFYRDVIK